MAIVAPHRLAADDVIGIGFGKNHPRNDPTLTDHFAQRGYHCVWSTMDNLAGRLRNGSEVFYDDDGKYLQSGNAVLVLTRQE